MKTSDKDLNKNSTIQRILDLLEKKNIKQKELANYLGISTSIFDLYRKSVIFNGTYLIQTVP